ncbi:hypothetical protein F0P96_01705 [Hymenobacter busanensis]|uniref:Uncharacterized protein n=1 Tax=Hymenobacter busanensis TaxID=2607656 RepID=A0A7L4ZTX0_9BACT|nr:hypothetical protein [Hymenobacter busanensis]KAA9339360.1 hypothetical protein F0P96_01705 [Hymenobacter busanensis]QHJ06879.1 hypothetical protein GUY19_06045 [Hymenobacter busanensis]
MPTSSYLTIEYDPVQHLLVGRWLRAVMPFELHRGYAALLNAAEEHNCSYWLIDTSQRRGVIDAADVNWIIEQFFPQLYPRLGRTTFLAYVMATHQLAGVLADTNIPNLTYFDGRPYRLERFTNESQAIDWLLYCYEYSRAAH